MILIRLPAPVRNLKGSNVIYSPRHVGGIIDLGHFTHDRPLTRTKQPIVSYLTVTDRGSQYSRNRGRLGTV